MKINYRIEMEKELERIHASGRRPLLVLHACCAPCSSAVLEQLRKDFRIIVYYYNPNIAPREEFEYRARELERLIREMLPDAEVRPEIPDYNADEFYSAVRGHEQDPEGGDRCGICFDLRLRKTAEYAKAVGADYFTTTLSISPLKDAQRLNSIGRALSEETGVPYLFSDFKKKDGYRRSCELSAEYGLYRQDYCGCVFSRLERQKQQTEKQSPQ